MFLVIYTFYAVPTFVDITNPVYALIGSRVHMSCFPNETTAPVLWGLRYIIMLTASNLIFIIGFMRTITFSMTIQDFLSLRQTWTTLWSSI